MLLHAALTERTIGAFFHVYNRLGTGFLESVYRKALARELRKRGLEAREEHPITVLYDGTPVGFFRADLFVGGAVVLEIKAAEAIARAHVTQLLNYLLASDVELGLLLNFGPTATFKRVVLTRRAEWRSDSISV
jgi:GxxExxY protein